MGTTEASETEAVQYYLPVGLEIQVLLRQEWMDAGVCKTMSYDDFFGDNDSKVTEAAAEACAACSVRLKCMTMALLTGDHGTFAGTSYNERKPLRARMVASYIASGLEVPVQLQSICKSQSKPLAARPWSVMVYLYGQPCKHYRGASGALAKLLDIPPTSMPGLMKTLASKGMVIRQGGSRSVDGYVLTEKGIETVEADSRFQDSLTV